MNFFVLFLYEILLWICALLVIPKAIYSLVVYKKYRKSLMQRLGFGFPSVSIKSKGEAKFLQYPSIWIHAVSVGETKAIVSLARELKNQFPKHPLIISSVTETGHEEAKRSLPFADHHVYFPLDLRVVVYRVIRRASPGLVILSESDFWPNFLDLVKKRGAKIVLVNGKMSERSCRRFRKLRFFSKELFSLFDLLCVQNELYKERFIESGANSRKTVVTGNLKFDDAYSQFSQEEVEQWKCRLGCKPGQIILTIGSTHREEELFLIKILKRIWVRIPNLKVLLAPRHPERFQEVAEILDKEKVSWTRFSSPQQEGNEQVALIDAMGILQSCYQIGDLALVGGSFVKNVGGHNVLEPCRYGKPVLFGPYMFSQEELVEAIKRSGAGRQCSLEELESILEEWIENPKTRKEIGERGFDLIQQLKGPLLQTLNAIGAILPINFLWFRS